jgi:RNA polymerase sigma-70 factor (ECF subfamily)
MAEWVQFQSTLWTRMQLVRKNDSGAVREFVDRYRAPVLHFLRNAGFAEADAEDLSQEVFTRLLAEDVLAKAEREKGRFRSFLLAVTRNVIREERRRRGAVKRGGGGAPVSLDQEEIAEPSAPEPEGEEFDRAWIGNLLSAALAALEKEQPLYHRALRAHLQENKDYKDIAAELGKSLQDVKNYIHRARQKLTELLQREVSRYASSPEEYEDEVRSLSRYLKA